MKSICKNFLLCGFSGWCMECFWSGLSSLKNRTDKQLHCQTSVWMFPIYGMAVCLSPIYKKIRDKSTIARGCIYTGCIYVTEFITGTLLKKIKACPWDYSKARLNIKGVIRLDYAPAWFLLGLFFESLLKKDTA